VLTADFNFRPDQPEYALLQLPLEGSPRYRDAWTLRHGIEPHAPTVGVHDKKQWKGKPFCFDMVFVTEDLAARVEDIRVDAATDASDHQPVMLRLAD
jgi:endonuclease/exonuclease/phosphatase family metal-dependent hydrolase